MATLGLYFQIRDDYANLSLKEVKLLRIGIASLIADRHYRSNH